MTRHVKRHPPTEATHDEALRIARGTQRLRIPAKLNTDSG
jgi:hypothetical protein